MIQADVVVYIGERFGQSKRKARIAKIIDNLTNDRNVHSAPHAKKWKGPQWGPGKSNGRGLFTLRGCDIQPSGCQFQSCRQFQQMLALEFQNWWA